MPPPPPQKKKKNNNKKQNEKNFDIIVRTQTKTNIYTQYLYVNCKAMSREDCQTIMYIHNGVAKTMKKLRKSKGDYQIKHCFSSIVSLFKVGTSLKGKEFAPRGSEFFPLRAVPY